MNPGIRSHLFNFILKNGKQLTCNVELLDTFNDTQIFKIAMEHFTNSCYTPLELEKFYHYDCGIVNYR